MRTLSLLLLSLLLAMPLVALAQPPLPGPPLPGAGGATLLPTAQVDYDALAKYTYMMGKIIAVNPTSRTITFHVEYQVQQPLSFLVPADEQGNEPRFEYVLFQLSKAEKKELKKLTKELNKIEKIQDPFQQEQKLSTFLTKIGNQQLRQQIMAMPWVSNKLAKMAAKNALLPPPGAIKPGTQTVTFAKEFILDVASNAIIARKELPLELNDKGEAKKYSEDELNAKRDTVLTGFKANFDDLAAGQTVYVYFKLGKAQPPATVPDTKSDKTPDAKKDDKKDEKKPGDNAKKDDKDANGGDKKADPKPDVKDPPKSGDTPLPPRPSNSPVVRAVLILSDPGLADNPLKKKKDS